MTGTRGYSRGDGTGGVYAGVRVLELAEGLAAPYTTMFLADQGADVVKVESPDGDPYRVDPGFPTVNRSKRSVTVDDTVRDRLVAAADVIVVDRPGRADALRALNPDAVIVTMPPWGERGPMVGRAATTGLLHAATGIAWNQQSYAEVPVRIVVPIAEYATGVLGALAAAAGLVGRGRPGSPAPTYEVSRVAGAAALQLGESRPADAPVEVRPSDALLGSKGRVACYRLVQAGDGRWLFLACGTARFYQRMLEVIGRPDLADDPDLADPPWGLLTDEAIERLTPVLDEVFATRPRDEWLAVLADADVPAQPVLTREEFRSHSSVSANRMLVTVDDPERGPVTMMGVPVTVEDSPPPAIRPAPVRDADHDGVLADWLSRDPARTDQGPDGAAGNDGSGLEPEVGAGPLAGLRVIDLASFIAGPVVSRHLAMLGAEVIKVEPPTGDPFRAIGPLFLSWNQGKRSIALDLTTAEGQAELHQLAATADVVVENFRPGVAARLGVDRDTLGTVNPDLVFLSSPGYGLDEAMASRPAFDPLVQALGGIMAAQGGLGDGGPEPVFLTVPVHDVVTPIIGAFGAVLGLTVRARTGRGQLVRTSLIESTVVAQAAEFTDYEGRPAPAVGGFDNPGPEGDTWTGPGSNGSDDGWHWRDGDHTVEVCRVGLTASPLAEANGLVTTIDDPGYGRLVVFGQLIGGAGPAPSAPPQLDADAGAIRAELEVAAHPSHDDPS